MSYRYKDTALAQALRYRFRSFDAPDDRLYVGFDQGGIFMDSERLFDLRQLEAFAAVISTGSVTGAAKVIGKSQPVVSRLIQELESDLGFDLFTRYGRRITPTENGVSFYREVERLFAQPEIEPPILHGSASLATVLSLVVDGTGIGTLPLEMAAEDAARGRIVPVRVAPELTLSAVEFSICRIKSLGAPVDAAIEAICRPD